MPPEYQTCITQSGAILPVPNSTLPYWRTEPHHLDSHRSTAALPSSCDVLIIGAGMAGASVAYHLSNSSPCPPSIILLEARETCSGATGRNGGHIKVKLMTLFTWLESYGGKKAADLARFVKEQIYALKEVVEGEGLDCEFELRRSFDVFLDEREATEARRSWEECLRGGWEWTKDADFVGERFAERVTSVKGAKAAFSSPACSLWPYKFVTQLLERTLAKGNLNLQTNTPVTDVTTSEAPDGTPVNVVTTPRGTVTARKLVFATNGYTAGVLPQYKDIITPVRGAAAHIAVPMNAPPAGPHLSNTYNIEFGQKRVDYFNPRPDGGIVLGGGKWLFEKERALWFDVVDDATLIDPAKGYFDGYMQRNFWGWEGSGAATASEWTGIMGFTKDQLPHIGKVPGTANQWILAGFNGGGMPLIFLSAKGVANMVRDDLPFEEAGTIPALFKTTMERLG